MAITEATEPVLTHIPLLPLSNHLIKVPPLALGCVFSRAGPRIVFNYLSLGPQAAESSTRSCKEVNALQAMRET